MRYAAYITVEFEAENEEQANEIGQTIAIKLPLDNRDMAIKVNYEGVDQIDYTN